MAVLISGGGTKESNIIVNRFFAEFIHYGNVLYIPNAGDESVRSYQESYAYVKDMFEDLGIRKVDMVFDLSVLSEQFLSHYDAIYFSGGSISKLLKSVQNANAESCIKSFEKTKVLYGQSAGGIALGCDVSYFEECKHTEPLSIVDFAITCHYRDEYLERIKSKANSNTYCIRDNEAILFEHSRIKFINGKSILIKTEL